MSLGVNIDHVATLRQARGGIEPDIIEAALLCERAGCDGITVHLREDRRHINEKDLRQLRKTIKTRLNLEMAVCDEIVEIACQVKPDQITLVPEKRQELTTEGGLDIISNEKKIKKVVERFSKYGIISIFVDPDSKQVEAASKTGAEFIELHTGSYANALTQQEKQERLKELRQAGALAMDLGLRLNAGHGLNYQNVVPIIQIPKIEELNIGHSIISRAVMVGLEAAVREMIELIKT
ncbi:MAG: pyridoxine 5'-phosphate synthase [Candidatus Omnitrophica bacterium]|nr:pyridoxine 5'-phosphate synthase [Candidatus Omnitrophota bacterium]